MDMQVTKKSIRRLSDEERSEIYNYSNKHTDAQTTEHFKIASSTLYRIKRDYKAGFRISRGKNVAVEVKQEPIKKIAHKEYKEGFIDLHEMAKELVMLLDEDVNPSKLGRLARIGAVCLQFGRELGKLGLIG